VVIAARGLGKWKAFGTNVAIVVLLLAFDARTGGPVAGMVDAATIGAAGCWVAVAAAVLAVISGVAYLRAAVPILLGRDR
jgi:phosphatidylglycerophosphate synthase